MFAGADVHKPSAQVIRGAMLNTDTFAVVPARTRRYGYALQAPPGITWAVGPGRTVGWYRCKRDALQACASLNHWLA